MVRESRTEERKILKEEFDIQIKTGLIGLSDRTRLANARHYPLAIEEHGLRRLERPKNTIHAHTLLLSVQSVCSSGHTHHSQSCGWVSHMETCSN